MERVIKVCILGKGEIREVTLQEAQRILEDTYDDPIGGLVADARTGEVIWQIVPDIEEIIVMEQMLGGASLSLKGDRYERVDEVRHKRRNL